MTTLFLEFFLAIVLLSLGFSTSASAATSYSSLSVGGAHACAVTTSGAAKCWGDSHDGQLGVNAPYNNGYRQVAPAQVFDLASGASSISAGISHTCAVTTTGSVKCWGSDQYGQLGDGSATPTSVIRQVQGLTSGGTRVDAGDGATCAIVSGGVKCWGANYGGQLGDGTTNQSTVPVQVVGLTSGTTDIAVASVSACAVVSAGVKCWGEIVHSNTPVSVTGLTSGVSSVALSDQSGCALMVSGAVKCWSSTTALTDVTGLGASASSISMASGAMCATLTTGALKCWGNNSNGQLGIGTFSDAATPSVVSGLASGTSMASVGSRGACALLATGGIKCWGYNYSGQLGDGTRGVSRTPIAAVGFETSTTEASASESGTCAVVSTVASCVGRYEDEASGGVHRAPTPVTGLGSGVTSISSGALSACALVSGAAKCWGSNFHGALGNGSATSSAAAVQAQGLTTGTTSISVGDDHACAVNGGAVKCWGRNTSGQLGTGNNSASGMPLPVVGLGSGATAVSAGANYFGGASHTCAVVSAAAKCWGSNSDGQLGNGDDGSFSSEPVDVGGLQTGVATISAGVSHSCAVTTGGAAKCWGNNYSGALGDGTDEDSATPVGVSGLTSGVTSIAASSSFTCAVASGAAKCWGANYAGQLGTGGASDSHVPVQVEGLSSGVASVTTAENYACARMVSQSVVCWGEAYEPNHALSNPNQWKNTPVAVSEPRDLLDVTITSPVNGQTVHTTTPTLEFSVSDAVGVITECVVDDGPATRCDSPFTPSPLSEGFHSLSIVAIDAAGNVLTNASTNITVDSTPDTEPPSIEILYPSNGESIASDSVTVEFAASDDSSFSTYCSVDDLTAESCDGSATFSDLAPGLHSFFVLGVDDSGNESVATVTVTLTSPTSPPSMTPPSTPTPSAPAVPVAPRLATVPKSVRLGSPVSIVAYCVSACKLKLAVTIGKKTMKLPDVKVAGSASGVRVKIKLSSSAAKAVKKALKKKQSAFVTITPADSANSGKAAKVKFKL